MGQFFRGFQAFARGRRNGTVQTTERNDMTDNLFNNDGPLRNMDTSELWSWR